MTLLPAIVLCAAGFAANMQILVAPDQPLPFVYLDDPLVIEITLDETMTAAVRLRFDTPQGEKTIENPPEQFRANDDRWCVFRDLPPGRGFHAVTVEVVSGDTKLEQKTAFCRLDRLETPAADCLFADAAGTTAMLALRAGGVHLLRLPALGEKAYEHAAEAVDLGLELILVLEPRGDWEASVKQLATEFGAHTKRWEIDARGDAALLAKAVLLLRENGYTGTISFVAGTMEAFASMFENEAAKRLGECTLYDAAATPATVAQVCAAAERAGYEGWRVHVFGGMPEAGREVPEALFEALEAGAASYGFPGAAACDTVLRDTVAYTAGLANGYRPGRFWGRASLKDGLHALLFRHADEWMLAAWADAPGESTLSVGAAKALSLFDAFGNELSQPKPSEGRVKLRVSPDPVYLHGSGGSLPGTLAMRTAAAEARAFLNNAAYREILPKNIVETVTTLSSSLGGKNSRYYFQTLVRSFPELENGWHTAAIPIQNAAPAIASLARFCRALCAIEQDRGEKFGDPLHVIMSRCEECQSLYLTGSAGDVNARERGDWLLGETHYLLDEADRLGDASLNIEAVAVATLAWWRARSLDFSADPSNYTDAPPLDAVAPETEPPVEEADQVGGDPPADIAAENVTEAAPIETPPPAAATASAPQEYAIEKGDTLSGIAKKFNLSTADLLEMNQLTPKSILRIGQKLKVAAAPETPAPVPEAPPAPETKPESSPPAPDPAPAPETKPESSPPAPDPAPAPPESSSAPREHTIASGDSLFGIAQKYKVNLDDLLKWNQLTEKSTLHIGQTIILQPPEGTSSEPEKRTKPDQDKKEPEKAKESSEKAPSAKTGEHAVASGDTLSDIASKYKISLDDLMKWNNLSKKDTLSIGQKLRLTAPSDNGAKKNSGASKKRKR